MGWYCQLASTLTKLSTSSSTSHTRYAVVNHRYLPLHNYLFETMSYPLFSSLGTDSDVTPQHPGDGVGRLHGRWELNPQGIVSYYVFNVQ